MAAPLTNHLNISISPRPFRKTFTMSSLVIRRNPNVVKLNPSLVLPKLSRRPFVSTVKVTETDSTTINGDEGLQDIPLPSMKEVVESYKEAILTGDDQSIAELEKIIHVFETSKNNLSTKLTSTLTEISSKKDKLLRLSAEFDNFRKQFDKDKLRFSSDIQVDVLESLLPIIDSFEKAKLELVPETEKETKIGTSYQGIYKQFVEVLRSLGVSIVETVGKPFDPSVHEAIGREESEEFKAGIVCEEIKRGFLLKDKVLRPAFVKVSNGLGQIETQPASENNDDVASDIADDSTPES